MSINTLNNIHNKNDSDTLKLFYTKNISYEHPVYEKIFSRKSSDHL